MSAMTSIPNLATNLTDFLAQVEKNLEISLADDEQTVALSAGRSDTLMSAARHLVLGGAAKRARPLLVRLFADAVGAPAAPLVDVAAAAELIHNASLLHDDVVDAGMFRRGRPTVNARWGNIVAVMTGDMLLSTALGKLAAIDSLITQDAIKLVMEMTRAAIAEVEARSDLALPLDRLRFIAEGKTGALFGWCGMAAARLAGKPDVGARFEAFGRRLGVAFQIADDVRDLTGTDEGKPQYADVQSKTPSLPILLAASGNADLRRMMRDAWAFSAMSPERVSEIGKAIQGSGAIDRAIEKMNQEISAAIDALGPYASAPGGSELVGWAHKLGENVKPRGAA